MSTSLQFSFFLPLPHLPIQSQHACVQSALTALASLRCPPRRLQNSLLQCHARTCSHKGSNEIASVLTMTPRECIVFLLSEEMLKIVFFHVARNTNSFLCVRNQKGIITTVLDLSLFFFFFFFWFFLYILWRYFLFLYNHLSFWNDLLTDQQGLSYRDFLSKK